MTIKSCFDFLYDLKNDSGETLADIAYACEELYRKDFYQFIPFAGRLFIEQFVNTICSYKGINLERHSNGTINVGATLRYIFESSDYQDYKFYKNYKVKDWYQYLNECSHLTIFDKDSSTLKYNNESLLEFIYNLSRWFFSRINNTHLPKENFYLPIVSERETTIPIDNNLKEQYNHLIKLYDERSAELNMVCIEKNGLIKEKQNLENTIVKLKTYINNNILSNNTALQQDEKNSNESLLKDYCSAKREISLLNHQIKNYKLKLLTLEEEIKKAKEDNQNINITASNKKDTKDTNPLTTFINDVEDVVVAMNKIGCYATMRTIHKFLVGIESEQTKAYPALIKCEK